MMNPTIYGYPYNIFNIKKNAILQTLAYQICTNITLNFKSSFSYFLLIVGGIVGILSQVVYADKHWYMREF